MQINAIFLFLLLAAKIYSLEPTFINFNYILNREMGINDLLKPIIISLLSTNMTTINNLNISETCKSKLNRTYFSTNNYTYNWRNWRNIERSVYYYSKLFFDSSKNKNDLGSPEKCQTKNNEEINFLRAFENLTYISVLIEKEKSYYEELKNDNNNDAFNFFGLCIIDGCKKKDYIQLIYNFIVNLKSNNNIENNKIIEKEDISIFYLKNKIRQDKLLIKILKYIPLIFILIHILFVICNWIPLYLYKFFVYIFLCECKKKKKKGNIKIKRILSKDKGQLVPRDTDYSINNSLNASSMSYSSKVDKVNEIINILFNIDKNFKYLKEYKKENENSHDTGLSYINGLRGISMIFFLFGNVFMAIYNSPVVEPNINHFFKNLKNFFYFIFYFGIKYSPKILISCSGFTLFYKFVCFLDKKVELEKEIIKQREERISKTEDRSSISDSDIFTNTSDKNRKSIGSKTFNFKSLVHIKYLGIFIAYQLHKYFIYIIMMAFFLFSFYEIISIFHGIGPVWDFFNKKIIQPSHNIGKIIPLFFGFQGYLLPFLRNGKYNLLNYFNIVYQEIFYFIISTILLFFGYKKNIRIEVFIGIIILILFLLRIIFYICYGFLNNRDYFSFKNYGLFYSSVFYNYIYYLIGIYFGMLNYVIQKRYSILDCKKNKKIYLIHSIQVIEIIKKRKKFPVYLGLIFFIVFLLIIFFQQIFTFILKLINKSIKNTIISYDKNIFVSIIMMIDSDIIILAINLMAIFMYLKGNNIISNFINNNFWTIFNKLYFSFILFTNPIILYVIYITETKIKFDMINCFFYSFISGILLFSMSSFVYVVFELPYKKAIRYWFKFSEKEVNDERFNNIETSFNYSQTENKGYSTDENNSEEEEINEDEEDEEDYD